MSADITTAPHARPASEIPAGTALISVLIVNYNGAALLPGCLGSLKRVVDPRVEVVVVDNASRDNSLEVLRGYDWVRVVRSRVNSGFAGGNNLGLQHCSGRYILLLNNDTIVVPGFLEVLSRYLEEHPEVGIAQGKMILPRFGNTLDVCGSFFTAFGLPYHYGYFKPDGPKYQRSFPIFSGKGACLMFRRDLIPRVGGFLFDPDFFCYYEESDFCHRAWLSGAEVHFVPSPAIQHLMGATSGEAHSSFVLRHYLRNMAFSLLSNLSPASRFRVVPLFFGMLAVGMLASILTFKPKHFAAHWGALWHCLSNRRKIGSRRNLIGEIRQKSDQEVFAKVLRTPSLDYFFKTFAGKLGQFVDPDLN